MILVWWAALSAFGVLLLLWRYGIAADRERRRVRRQLARLEHVERPA